MTERKPSPGEQSRPEQAGSRGERRAIGGVRNDLNTMLLPMFTEQAEATSFQTEVDGCILTMQSGDGEFRLPTALDRKILNLLAAHVRDVIRSGGRPTRHILVHRQELLDLLNGSGTHAGGADYRRLNERLNRLLSARIIAERAVNAQTSRRRHFRWIDAFEEELRQTGRGKELVRLKISLSEDAFSWITRNEGFDMTHQQFSAITSSGASISRIFDICLAKLVYARGEDVYMQIDDLRRRVPISAHLRSFKSRTLKNAMSAISASPDMSRLVSLELCKRAADGFHPLDGQTRLENVYLRVSKGPGSLPSIDCLLPEDRQDGLPTVRLAPGQALANLLHEGDEILPLFEDQEADMP